MDKSLDTAPNGYVTFDDKGIIIEVNTTFCEMVGFNKSEIAGTKFEMLLDIAGRIFFQTHFFPLLKIQKKVDEIFLNLKTKESNLVPVITSAILEENNGSTKSVCVFLPVHNRRRYEDEILAAKKQAQEALNENKELIETREEINRHSKELDKKVNQLNRVNNEILQFSNIIHHEMQECIRKILIFSRLGQQDGDKDYLGRIIETANKLKTINSSLTIFIGLDKDQVAFKPVDLNYCLEQAKMLVIENTGFTGLEMTCDQLPDIEGMYGDLNLLFYHLLSNSVNFRKGDNVSMHITSSIYKENIYKELNRRYEYHDVVKITLRDNGQGFDNKYREYVFAILKRLNHETGGSGIGLAICKKIVDNHSGTISIDSTEDIGTTVKIVLPIKQ